MSEILSYEKFIENLRRYLLDALNLQEERIYFKVKDEAGMTPEGDRLFVESMQKKYMRITWMVFL